jgi:hypothetical protein
MPYDPNLDVNKYSESVELEGTKITVGIFSYNDGESKLQISRERINSEGGATFAKLGRMTKEEVEKVVPLIQKAFEKM